MFNGADNGQSAYFIGDYPVFNKVVREVGQRAFDNFRGGAGAPGDIIDDAGGSPGAVEMRRPEPVAASYEADLMARRLIEKQSPAFLSYLNVIGQVERHGLIYPADAVDAELFDDNLFENPGFFGFFSLVSDYFFRLFIH
jgi:hypothetical protein